MDGIIDLSAFRLRKPPVGKGKKSRERKRPVKPVEGLFLKGPISLSWLGRASRLPGKTFHVAISLWQLVGMAKARTVKMRGGILSLMGITRQAYSRGLSQLETAGLVSVERASGRTPVVTLLDLN